MTIPMLMILAACAPKERLHAVTPVALPPPLVIEAAPPPPSPAGWHTGQVTGLAIERRPVERWSLTMPGPITVPIATDGANVFVVADGRVRAVSPRGSTVWEVRVEASTGVLPTPGGLVVGTSSGKILTLDPASGATLLESGRGGAVRGVPVAIGEDLAWTTVGGTVVAASGWAMAEASSTSGGAAADGDTVYIATLDAEVLAVRAGVVVWRADLPAAAADGPTLDANHVYVPIAAAEGQPGGVLAFSRTGAEVWRARTEFQPGAPLAVGDAVYVADKDSHVYALETETGAVRWVAEGFGEFSTQPMLLGGSVYVGNGDGNLYRIDGFDGGVAWKQSLGAPMTGEPAYAAGAIVVGLANGRVIALEDGG